jgi:hypothetical protein
MSHGKYKPLSRAEEGKSFAGIDKSFAILVIGLLDK